MTEERNYPPGYGPDDGDEDEEELEPVALADSDEDDDDEQDTFLNPNATVEYTHPDWRTKYPSWTKDKDLAGKPGRSVMVFKAHQTGDDEDRALELSVRTDVQFSTKEARRAKRRNQEYDPKLKQTRLMPADKASILSMAVSWDGPFTILPRWHSNAGEKALLNARFLGMMAPYQIAGIIEFLNQLNAKRSDESEAEFPESDPDLGGSGIGEDTTTPQPVSMSTGPARLLRVGDDALDTGSDPLAANRLA